MNEGQVLHNSPYVAQIEKFADSLKQLFTYISGAGREKAGIFQRRD